MGDVIKTLAVIQHTSAEYLGLIEDHLEGRRIRFQYYRPFTSAGLLPEPSAITDGLVLLGGGPWGACAAGHPLPTLAAEIALTRQALAAHVPVIGIGLGAVILALAAGGDAAPTALRFTVGTARRTAAQALGGWLPERYPLVRYGRDDPLLPDDAVTLAEDQDHRPALFQIGERAFGFLGHPGIKSAIVEDLIMEFAEAPDEIEIGLQRLRESCGALEQALIPLMTGLIHCTGLMRNDIGGLRRHRLSIRVS
jgi:GMP synthase-like glutamine amidotransferase